MSYSDQNYYEEILFIRRFEEMLLELFSEGLLSGTTHTSIGQEVVPVSLMKNLSEKDTVFSNHRCHGHYLSYGGPAELLLAEIMGKKEGVSGGRGGSQHVSYKNFHSNGIQGGIVGNAVGVGLAEKMSQSDNIAVVFLGDGTLGEGLVYEAFNMAGLFSLPVLFVLENNLYAQSTPHEKSFSGSIGKRVEGFGIGYGETDTRDPQVLEKIFRERIQSIRSGEGPFFQTVYTYRYAPHSKGDDFREKEEIENYQKKDSLLLLGERLDKGTLEAIKRDVEEKIEGLKLKCDSFEDPENDLGIKALESLDPIEMEEEGYEPPKALTYLSSINEGLGQILEKEEKSFLLGEDIIDPYGGAFKVTKGLSSRFADRVLGTPISEAAIVALGVGAGFRGYKAIVEIMFGDFVALCSDQLINHAAKYSWMYNGKINIPIIVRIPSGGRRGYGPTHSQNLEKIFMGIPGLILISPSLYHNPGAILKAASRLGKPVVFIEPKELYPKKLKNIHEGREGYFSVSSDQSLFPTLKFNLRDDIPIHTVIVTYGAAVSFALEAAESLLTEEEINVAVLVPSCVSPFPLTAVKKFMGRARNVVTVEEATVRGGWGGEVIAEMVESGLCKKARRVGAADSPVPASKTLEDYMYYDKNDIVRSVVEMESDR